MTTKINGTTGIEFPNGGVQSSSGDLKQVVTAASGALVDFTGIPSWAKRITVSFEGISTTGTSGKIVQIGDAGGIENTGYLSSESNIAASVGSANVTSGFGIRSVAAADVVHGGLTLIKGNGNAWTAFGVFGLSSSATTLTVAGSKTLSDTLTQIRVTTQGGTDTFDAGTITVTYE